MEVFIIMGGIVLVIFLGVLGVVIYAFTKRKPKVPLEEYWDGVLPEINRYGGLVEQGVRLRKELKSNPNYYMPSCLQYTFKEGKIVLDNRNIFVYMSKEEKGSIREEVYQYHLTKLRDIVVMKGLTGLYTVAVTGQGVLYITEKDGYGNIENQYKRTLNHIQCSVNTDSEEEFQKFLIEIPYSCYNMNSRKREGYT